MFTLVSYDGEWLFNSQNVDKQIKITVFDMWGNGSPLYERPGAEEYLGKTYLDMSLKHYYRCIYVSGRYGWESVREDEIQSITNRNIQSESLELNESLCSGQSLRFGSCESSSIRFRLHDFAQPLKNKWILVSAVLGGKMNIPPFYFGVYKVFSDRPTADRKYREVVAYDAMYDILNADVSGWYEKEFEGGNPNLVKFYTDFLEVFGLKAFHKQNLPNAGRVIVEKTLKAEELSGKDVITAICEINGCFGHIGRGGYFEFVFLEQNIQGLYPSVALYPSEDLFPAETKAARVGNGAYKRCDYEDFVTRPVDRVHIRKEEKDAGVLYPKDNLGADDNVYVVEGNFLLNGKSKEELNEIAGNMFNTISGVSYRPFSAECIGNPCFEVGDAIMVSAKNELIESYVMSRKLSGIQNLNDSYEAQGVEKYIEELNSPGRQIQELKNRANILERNVEETSSEIYYIDENGEKRSKILQNAEKIELKVSIGDVTTQLNIEDGVLELVGNRVTIESDNFKLTKEGEADVKGNITARNGITFVYKDFEEEADKEYKFAETGYNNPSAGGMADEPFLNIYSPKGNQMIVMGTGLYNEHPSKFRLKDTPYFPNGAMIKDAYIDSIYTTFKETINLMDEESTGIVDGVLKKMNTLKVTVRKSGAFVSVSGKYSVFSHPKDKTLRFEGAGNIGVDCNPTNGAVTTFKQSHGRIFLFNMDTNGTIAIRNTGDDINTKDGIEVLYRFDYFLFP